MLTEAKAIIPDDELDDYLDELVDLLVSRIVNNVTGKAVDQYLIAKLLGNYSRAALLEALDGQSEAIIERLASNTVNASIASGRDTEIEKHMDEIESIEYSAILDKSTCGPCEDADGETATDQLDLTPAPNPDCEGSDNCRCIHIATIV